MVLTRYVRSELYDLNGRVKPLPDQPAGRKGDASRTPSWMPPDILCYTRYGVYMCWAQIHVVSYLAINIMNEDIFLQRF